MNPKLLNRAGVIDWKNYDCVPSLWITIVRNSKGAKEIWLTSKFEFKFLRDYTLNFFYQFFNLTWSGKGGYYNLSFCDLDQNSDKRRIPNYSITFDSTLDTNFFFLSISFSLNSFINFSMNSSLVFVDFCVLKRHWFVSFPRKFVSSKTSKNWY